MWFVKFVNNDDELVIVEVMLENMSTKGVWNLKVCDKDICFHMRSIADKIVKWGEIKLY